MTRSQHASGPAFANHCFDDKTSSEPNRVACTETPRDQFRELLPGRRSASGLSQALRTYADCLQLTG